LESVSTQLRTGVIEYVLDLRILGSNPKGVVLVGIASQVQHAFKTFLSLRAANSNTVKKICGTEFKIFKRKLWLMHVDRRCTSQ
jgi:hypothetical protein